MGGLSGRDCAAATIAPSSQNLSSLSKETLRLLDPLCHFLQKAQKYLGIYIPQGSR